MLTTDQLREWWQAGWPDLPFFVLTPFLSWVEGAAQRAITPPVLAYEIPKGASASRLQEMLDLEDATGSIGYMFYLPTHHPDYVVTEALLKRQHVLRSWQGHDQVVCGLVTWRGSATEPAYVYDAGAMLNVLEQDVDRLKEVMEADLGTGTPYFLVRARG